MTTDEAPLPTPRGTACGEWENACRRSAEASSSRRTPAAGSRCARSCRSRRARCDPRGPGGRPDAHAPRAPQPAGALRGHPRRRRSVGRGRGAVRALRDESRRRPPGRADAQAIGHPGAARAAVVRTAGPGDSPYHLQRRLGGPRGHPRWRQGFPAEGRQLCAAHGGDPDRGGWRDSHSTRRDRTRGARHRRNRGRTSTGSISRMRSREGKPRSCV